MSGRVHGLLHKLPGFWPQRQRAHRPFGSPIPYVTQQAGSKPTPKSPSHVLLLLLLRLGPLPPPQRLCSPGCGSQVWPNICPCSVLSCQNWPVVPACWGLHRPNFLVPHISCSSQLPVLCKSDPHAVSGLGQPIDKNDQEGEAERKALNHTSRDPHRVSSPRRRHCLRQSLPEVPICSQKFQCQLSQCHTDIQCQG